MTRISKLAYCCGLKYWRWRYPNRPPGPTWPRKGMPSDLCCVCKRPLRWQASPATRRAASSRYYQRRRQAYLEAGLTTRGTPRRRILLTPSERAGYNLTKWHRRARRLVAAGLTTRGTVPIRKRTLPALWTELLNSPKAPEFLSPLERGEAA